MGVRTRKREETLVRLNNRIIWAYEKEYGRVPRSDRPC
jgi:hypothetical protein